MNDLREKIHNLALMWALNGSEWPSEFADEVLAIPEIAEALANQTCACGAEATVHECMSCSSLSNSDL